MFVSARFFITFCDDDFDPRAYHRRRDLSLSLSLSLRRSFVYRTNSAFSHAELSFSFSFSSSSSSFSLSLDDDDDDDVFTTLFIRAFLSRADIFLLSLSLSLLLVFTDHC